MTCAGFLLAGFFRNPFSSRWIPFPLSKLERKKNRRLRGTRIRTADGLIHFKCCQYWRLLTPERNRCNQITSRVQSFWYHWPAKTTLCVAQQFLLYSRSKLTSNASQFCPQLSLPSDNFLIEFREHFSILLANQHWFAKRIFLSSPYYPISYWLVFQSLISVQPSFLIEACGLSILLVKTNCCVSNTATVYACWWMNFGIVTLYYSGNQLANNVLFQKLNS